MDERKKTRREYTLESGINKNIDTSFEKFNPFEQILSLNKIIELETTGIVLNNEETEQTKLVKKIVTKSLDSLVSEEREVVIRFFYLGQSIGTISKETGRSSDDVGNLKDRAFANLSINLQKYRKELKLYDVYNDCVICNYINSDEINFFIQEWLERTNWNFWGIITGIKKKFGLIVVGVSVVTVHVQYHSTIETPVGFGEKEEAKYIFQIQLPVSIGNEIEKLEKLTGAKHGDIVRRSLRIGLKMVNSMLDTNEMLFDEAAGLAKVMRKLKNLE